MAFHHTNNIARFNSDSSASLLDFYESNVKEALRLKAAEPSQHTFAPSSIRCQRKSWFRIRGTEPDVPEVIDTTLQFTADIGTACHRIIQTNLKNFLGKDWISIPDWFEQNQFNYEYVLTPSKDSLETYVELTKPYPIRFACDGIIRWKGKYYLLEIKSVEFSSWRDLTDQKDEHTDQVNTYCTLLNLSGVLFIYIDRQYGGMKCYEYNVSDIVKEQVIKDMDNVMFCVDANIPPEPLPKGDKWCNAGMCPYYKKCAEWGR